MACCQGVGRYGTVFAARARGFSFAMRDPFAVSEELFAGTVAARAVAAF